MQVAVSNSKRIVVVSGDGSAASALPQMPIPLRPAAPVNAALVRNWRRLCIATEHLPDPNGWMTMSLARWPFRAVRIEVVGRASVSPGLVMMIGWCRFAVEGVDTQRRTGKDLFAQFKDFTPLARLRS